MQDRVHQSTKHHAVRGWGVIRTVVGAALIAVALGHPGSPAGAATSVRAGWWSQVSPAPAPPDVPEDGLHVAGGVSGPTAVAAVAYHLPGDAIATSLTLELVGMSPRADGLRACAIPLDAAAFEPAHNGAWTEVPAYDCDAGAAPVALAGTTATFAVGALQQGNVLAVALVPGSTDRASIAKPEPASLAISVPAPEQPPASSSVAPSKDTTASPPVAPPATTSSAASSFVAPPAAPSVVDTDLRGQALALTDDEPVAAATVASTSTEQSTRTRIGGALGFALLLVALLFYSQGRGLLGARVGNT